MWLRDAASHKMNVLNFYQPAVNDVTLMLTTAYLGPVCIAQALCLMSAFSFQGFV